MEDDGICIGMSGGVDVPKGEKEDANPWLPVRDMPVMFGCPGIPKADDGGGEMNLGGGGDVA